MGLRIHRLRRLLASGSPVLFAGGIALAGLALSGFTKDTSLNPWVVLALLILWLGLLGFQMMAEYRRRTYDPTWVSKFDEKFDGSEMKRTRSRAAKSLRDNQERLDAVEFRSGDIDNVLDFFEGLGFFLPGDQITPEVAHHAFHHWIRGYYSAAQGYLEAARKVEPTHREFVQMLFDITNQVEKERFRMKGKHHERLLNEAGIAKFLGEEIRLEK